MQDYDCGIFDKEDLTNAMVDDAVQLVASGGAIATQYQLIKWAYKAQNLPIMFNRYVGWFAGTFAGLVATSALLDHALEHEWDDECEYNTTRFLAPLTLTACSAGGMLVMESGQKLISFIYNRCSSSTRNDRDDFTATNVITPENPEPEFVIGSDTDDEGDDIDVNIKTPDRITNSI